MASTDEMESEALVLDEGGADEGTVAAPRRKRAATAGPPKRVQIFLEENDTIPPTGLYIAHNGTPYVIKPGEAVWVPEELLEILDNAVQSYPVVDPETRKVIDTRDRLRYPYRRL